MANYLTVNRFNIPIMESAARFEPMGRSLRGVDGHLGGSFTSFRRGWRLKTSLLESADVESAQGLLLGDGHAWAFEDSTGLFTTSSRGLDDDGLTNVTRNTLGQKYGVACLQFGIGAANVSWLTGVRVPLAIEHWTVAFWFNTGSGYVHHAHDSALNFYLDGVLDAAPSEPALSVSTNGRVTLTDNNASTHVIDDLIIVPYIMSPSLIASIAADNNAFSQLPELTIGGTIKDAHTLVDNTGLVRPETFSRRVVRFGGSSGFTLGGSLEFDLVES